MASKLECDSPLERIEEHLLFFRPIQVCNGSPEAAKVVSQSAEEKFVSCKRASFPGVRCVK